MEKIKMQTPLPGLDPDSVYRALCDFSSYPELCSAVRSVDIELADDGSTLSNWEVNFQSGILKWRERDDFDPTTRRIVFEQIAGDIDHFSGCWQVLPHADGAVITFEAQFDLGIPMLADMLDPVAKKAIEDNVDSIIRGLFMNAGIEAA